MSRQVCNRQYDVSSKVSVLPALLDWSGTGQLPDLTYYVPYTNNNGNGNMCDCTDDMIRGNGVKDPAGNTWVGCGYCSGGNNWECCGCCIQSWNKDNKSECCDPTKQSSAVQCDPEWCPFGPSCEQELVTSNYCLNNVDDQNCYNICAKYNDKKSVDNGTRPDWCDAFMGNYCRRHGQDTATTKDLCACLGKVTPADECVWPACTNGSSSWMSKNQYSRLDSGCGTICFQMIQNINDGNVNISGNDFKQSCGQYSNSGGQYCVPSPSPGQPDICKDGPSTSDKKSDTTSTYTTNQFFSDVRTKGTSAAIKELFSSSTITTILIVFGIILSIVIVLIAIIIYFLHRSHIIGKPVDSTLPSTPSTSSSSSSSSS
jgi:hypothetical protein